MKIATLLCLWCLHLVGATTDGEEEKAHLRSSRELQSNALRVVGNNGSPASGFPLGECEGDCDNDSECASGLVCQQRSGNEPVSGCGSNSRYEGVDFCVRSSGGPSPSNPNPSPSGGSSLVYRGNDGSPSSAFPLGRCQGDCDGDSDCQGNLRCFQRDGFESVPGCSGRGSENTDYCYDPSSGSQPQGPSPSPPSGSSSGSFRIKMYWERGYYWQEETFERRWCFKCGGSSCNSGDQIYLRECGRGDLDYFEFVRYGDQAQIRVARTNLCLELMGSRTIAVNTCNSGNQRQRFTAGNGNFNSYRFELLPVTSNGCLSQSHHPREGEVIYMETCDLARRYDTSFYNRY